MVAGEVLVAVVAQDVSFQVILVHVTAAVVAHRDVVPFHGVTLVGCRSVGIDEDHGVEGLGTDPAAKQHHPTVVGGAVSLVLVPVPVLVPAPVVGALVVVILAVVAPVLRHRLPVLEALSAVAAEVALGKDRPFNQAVLVVDGPDVFSQGLPALLVLSALDLVLPHVIDGSESGVVAEEAGEGVLISLTVDVAPIRQ